VNAYGRAVAVAPDAATDGLAEAVLGGAGAVTSGPGREAATTPDADRGVSAAAVRVVEQDADTRVVQIARATTVAAGRRALWGPGARDDLTRGAR
jgi:hypothetical protein